MNKVSGAYNGEGFVLTYPKKVRICNWCKDPIEYNQPSYRRSGKYWYCSDHCIDEWILHKLLREEGLVAVAFKDWNCNVCEKNIPKGSYYWFTRNVYFCSEKCKCIHQSKIKLKSYGTASCEICQRVFVKRTKTQKVCSSGCYRKKGTRHWNKDIHVPE